MPDTLHAPEALDADEISDAELEALALAAEHDPELGDDAVSIWELGEPTDAAPLPAWYMPTIAGGHTRLAGWRRHTVLLIVVSFVLIDAFGLCATYGRVAFG